MVATPVWVFGKSFKGMPPSIVSVIFPVGQGRVAGNVEEQAFERPPEFVTSTRIMYAVVPYTTGLGAG